MGSRVLEFRAAGDDSGTVMIEVERSAAGRESPCQSRHGRESPAEL